jgi:hypothetical protein
LQRLRKTSDYFTTFQTGELPKQFYNNRFSTVESLRFGNSENGAEQKQQELNHSKLEIFGYNRPDKITRSFQMP